MSGTILSTQGISAMEKNPNMFFLTLFIIAYVFVFYTIAINIQSGLINNIGDQNKIKLLGEFSALFIAVCISSLKLFYLFKRYLAKKENNKTEYNDKDKKYFRLLLANIAVFFGLCAICYFDKNIVVWDEAKMKMNTSSQI